MTSISSDSLFHHFDKIGGLSGSHIVKLLLGRNMWAFMNLSLCFKASSTLDLFLCQATALLTYRRELG